MDAKNVKYKFVVIQFSVSPDALLRVATELNSHSVDSDGTEWEVDYIFRFNEQWVFLFKKVKK